MIHASPTKAVVMATAPLARILPSTSFPSVDATADETSA